MYLTAASISISTTSSTPPTSQGRIHRHMMHFFERGGGERKAMGIWTRTEWWNRMNTTALKGNKIKLNRVPRGGFAADGRNPSHPFELSLWAISLALSSSPATHISAQQYAFVVFGVSSPPYGMQVLAKNENQIRFDYGAKSPARRNERGEYRGGRSRSGASEMMSDLIKNGCRSRMWMWSFYWRAGHARHVIWRVGKTMMRGLRTEEDDLLGGTVWLVSVRIGFAWSNLIPGDAGWKG